VSLSITSHQQPEQETQGHLACCLRLGIATQTAELTDKLAARNDSAKNSNALCICLVIQLFLQNENSRYIRVYMYSEGTLFES
jgi:hypothetical protein